MKLLLCLICLALSNMSFGDNIKLKEQFLTNYKHSLLDGFFADIDDDFGQFIVVRDKDTPKIRYIHVRKKYEDTTIARSNSGFVSSHSGIRFIPSRELARGNRFDEKVIKLDFSGASELSGDEIQKIIFFLDFTGKEIDIEKVELINSINDSSHNAKLDELDVSRYFIEEGVEMEVSVE